MDEKIIPPYHPLEKGGKGGFELKKKGLLRAGNIKS